MENLNYYTYILHFFIIMPFLLYIGIYKCKIPNYIFNILIGISIIGFLYHGFKIFNLKK